MTDGVDKRRFALDHNFPAPVLHAFAMMLPHVELVPIAEIDEHLAEVDDWELILALHRHPQQWDGLVTNDEKLLALPKEMTVLSQTALTLIVAKGEGHSPIRAVGLLLCHLNHICHQSMPNCAQVWLLSVSQKNYEEPLKFLEKIAAKRLISVDDLFRQHRLPAKDLMPAVPRPKARE